MTPKQPTAMYGMEAYEAIEAENAVAEIMAVIDRCAPGVRLRVKHIFAKRDIHLMQGLSMEETLRRAGAAQSDREAQRRAYNAMYPVSSTIATLGRFGL